MKKVAYVVLVAVVLLMIFPSCAEKTASYSDYVADTAWIESEMPAAAPEESEMLRSAPSADYHTDPNDVNWVHEAVDREINRLVEAHVLFDTPPEMTYKKSEILSVTIYPPRVEPPTPTERQEIGVARISNRMEATLTGLGFAIKSQTPEEQAVSGLVPTRWSWEVKPVEKGEQYLNLSLLAIIEVDGEETQFVVKSFERKIPIHVTTGQILEDFVSENWKWAWGALLIPLVGYLLKRRKGKS